MESTITPSWLTEEFVKAALTTDIDIITLVDLKVTKPIPKGNNYACEIYRVAVKYVLKTEETIQCQSLIIKAPVGDVFNGLVLQTGIIQKEIKIYKEYLPKVKKLLNEHAEDILTPTSYSSSIENIMVLEDLMPSGYKMADRLQQLDFEHCALALKKLAKFHGASVKLYEDEPELIESLGKDLLYTPNASSEIKNFSKMSFQFLAQEVKHSPDLERYSEFLNQYSETVWNTMLETMKADKEQFNVLNHGDFWVNNMLFKYNSKEQPEQLKFIDLQLSVFASPAIDLLYFINTSVEGNVRHHKLAELIDIYYEELDRILALFETKTRITRSELDKQLNEREYFGFIVSVMVLPWILANPDQCKIVELNDILSENQGHNDSLITYYKCEPYKTIVLKRLQEYEKKGIFKLRG